MFEMQRFQFWIQRLIFKFKRFVFPLLKSLKFTKNNLWISKIKVGTILKVTLHVIHFRTLIMLRHKDFYNSKRKAVEKNPFDIEIFFILSTVYSSKHKIHRMHTKCAVYGRVLDAVPFTEPNAQSEDVCIKYRRSGRQLVRPTVRCWHSRRWPCWCWRTWWSLWLQLSCHPCPWRRSGWSALSWTITLDMLQQLKYWLIFSPCSPFCI